MYLTYGGMCWLSTRRPTGFLASIAILLGNATCFGCYSQIPLSANVWLTGTIRRLRCYPVLGETTLTQRKKRISRLWLPIYRRLLLTSGNGGIAMMLTPRVKVSGI